MSIQGRKYYNVPTDEIQITGWLKKQLEIQANGLSGNLDKVWPDVRDCTWNGGDKQDWERVPYWLDGFVPLAYLLKNEDMIGRSKKFIDAIIKDQREDGWLFKCQESDMPNYVWPTFLICKMLVGYYNCSGDERIKDVVYKALKFLWDFLQSNSISNWASARWFEALVSIEWVYKVKSEEWLLDLAQLLCIQGLDYKEMFKNWRYEEPRNNWCYHTHVVNLAMAIKSEALWGLFSEDADIDFPKKMLQQLEKFHGTAVGHFTGDECLSGNSPIQGTELCGVVEAMYSYETLFSVTGDSYWLDKLERLAYNALPATISPDMWTHQYLQMSNQIACYNMGDNPIFRTNSGEANLYGLEPHFGCCTANFNQGWPKLALNTFLKNDNEIVSAVIAPCTINTKIHGETVRIEESTLYPFRNRIRYEILANNPVTFKFSFHIPKWAKRVFVNGDETDAEKIFSIEKEWNETEILDVEFKFEICLNERPRNLFALSYGPLVYSLAIDEEWKMHEYEKCGVERKFPYCDYEIFPKSKWNYGFYGSSFEVIENDSFDKPFSTENPPVTISAKMVEVEWKCKDGFRYVCAETPESTAVVGAPETIVFKPYGCTNLRMTEMPVIK